jgi:CHAD domain-containing protein
MTRTPRHGLRRPQKHAAPRRPETAPQVSSRFAAKPADTIPHVAAGILELQYRLILDSRRRFLDHTDPDALHDLRVAINRFRQALRLFRPLLKKTSGPALDDALAAFRRKMGSLRDLEVWIAFLKIRVLARRQIRRPWRLYLAFQDACIRAARAEAVRRLRSAACERLLARIRRFLRRELPALSTPPDAARFNAFAATRLRKACRRLSKRRPQRLLHDPAALHDLRKRCKHVRYWAEFSAPALPPSVGRLAALMRHITGTLGDLHDGDVFLTAPRFAANPAPRTVTAAIRNRRTRLHRRLIRLWKSVKPLLKTDPLPRRACSTRGRSPCG